MAADTPVITPGGQRTTASDWAGDLDLGYAPSIVFFDRQGKEVMRIDAFFKTFHVQSVFDYVLQEAYLTEPSFQRFISARAERLREEGIDVDIWSD
jgi:thioredoxin-related protein